jgi:predicted nucleic acid-binding protein
MLFTRENECSAVLDACVLVPMVLCDTLLRLAEQPALYRPLWSEQILAEVARVLKSQFHKSKEQISWRLEAMRQAFPDATAIFPIELLRATECIPDKDDRHVLAAAISAHANVIVTQNVRHFPAACLAKFGVQCQTSDEFLIDQYHLSPQVVLDKLDEQGASMLKDRAFVITNLKVCAPGFCQLLKAHAKY